MSTWPPIWNQIKALEADRELVCLPVRVLGDPAYRALFLTPELHDVLVRKYAEDDYKRRYQALHARLEMFVTNEKLTSTYMKNLKPNGDGVWEIVNKKPNPSLRVFGLFATRDVFVATNHQLRSALGKPGSPEWSLSMRTARHEWSRRFSTGLMIRKLDEVISGAVYV